MLATSQSWAQAIPETGPPHADSTAARYSLCQNGQIQVWGNNQAGQLGLGYTGGTVAQPTANPFLTNVVAMVSGSRHSVALLADGTVRAWGINSNGELGLGYTSTLVNTPQVVPLTCVVALSANGSYTMALRADGTLWSWGVNDYAQLGYGSSAPVVFSATPRRVAIAAPVAQVACGPVHCLALLANGTVRGWGANGYSVFGTIFLQHTPTPINLPPGGIGTVARLASSQGNSALVTANGQVYTWGDNASGQIGNGSVGGAGVTNTPVAVTLPTGTRVTDLATTTNSACAITSTGQLLTWGGNANGELGDPNCASAGTLTAHPLPVPGPSLPAAAIAVRGLNDGFLATLAGGQARAWGSGSANQLGYPITPTPSGFNYSCTANSPVNLCPVVPTRPQAIPPVAVKASSTATCVGLPVELTATGGDGTTYTWAPATGLSATTGRTVTATLSSTTQYTVTSGCGTPATVSINVSPDCCAFEQAIGQGKIPVEVGGSYPDFASSPFNAPVGTYFHATQDVVLLNDAFNLAAGSVLLFEAGVSLHLDERAQLTVQDGATLTAACQEMWGGVVVHREAGGIHFASSTKARATLSHSYDGVVLEEAGSPERAPYFFFKEAEFRHNRRSISLHRWNGGAKPDNAIIGCSFDSDPRHFKAPWQYQSGTDYHYSEAHIVPEGDLRDVRFTGNYFANCQVGIWTEGQLPAWFHLTNSVFEDFQVAGISSGHPNGWNGAAPPLLTPSGRAAAYSWKLEGNRFHFPVVGMQPARQACDGCFQPHQFYPYTAGVMSVYPSLEATSNKFEQLHADTASWTAYGYPQMPPHIGLWVWGAEPRVERNRFYLLGDGAWFGSDRTPTTSYLAQNAFLNCNHGVVLGDWRQQGGWGWNTATADLSCNTYMRDDGGRRSGRTVGIYAALADRPTLRNTADNTTGQGLLKEYFVSGTGSAGVTPMVNAGNR